MGFVQVSETAAITSSGNLSGGHEKLRIEVPVTQAGYVHVEFSHDAPDGIGQDVDIYFDDFRVEHKHGAIVQADDYYPFGLTFNAYQLDGSLENRYKFQGQEHQDDLDLGWVQFKWRNHDPAIGRFFNVDPLAEKFVYNSTYAFSENKVISHIELEGLESVPIITPLVNFGSVKVNKNFYENFNEPQKGLNVIKNNKSYIKKSAQKHGVSAQAISSVIFQEKSAGWRGDLSNIVAEVVKSNDNTLSLGVGEIQVGLAAELMGMDPENLTDEQRQQVKDALKDPEKSIDLISKNILDMEEFVGRELTIEEVTYGHNAGKEALKTQIDEDKSRINRVSSRSLPYQEEISEIIEE